MTKRSTTQNASDADDASDERKYVGVPAKTSAGSAATAAQDAKDMADKAAAVYEENARQMEEFVATEALRDERQREMQQNAHSARNAGA